MALFLLGLKNKLKVASRLKGCGSIQYWIQHITNHLYYVAALSEGDGDLIISMWRSLLNHICNVHEGHEGPFTVCPHEPLEGRDWMVRGEFS